MVSAIISAAKSLTLTDKFPVGNINNEIISVGNNGTYDFESYLYFDISNIPDNINLIAADLVLYKIADFFKDNFISFMIYPLTDYFSSYSTYSNPCKYDYRFKTSFSPFTKNPAIEINITTIVSKWINASLINKGIVITGDKNKQRFTSFGSSLSRNTYLIPTLRLQYKQY